MKITEVRVETFRYTSDKAKDIQGHAHPTARTMPTSRC